MSRQVNLKLTETTRERELVETESAIRVFEKAYGWAKLVGGIATGLIALLVAGAAWESFNLRTTVSSALIAVGAARNSAETQINETASKTLREMTSESATSVKAIRTSVKQANESSSQVQAAAKAQSAALTKQAGEVRRDFQGQAEAVTKDVASARQQIQAASQLQPQMAALQQQLGTAQAQIQDQQKVLTSSADFVKKIFSSHTQFSFDKKTARSTSFALLEGPPKTKDTQESVVLYLLLPSSPIAGTLELQFNQIPSAPGSFFSFHNLLICFIQKQAQDELLGKPITVSFFPDPDDKMQMHTLVIKDGRVFADDEALPKFGTTDPGFTGSKFFPVVIAEPQTPAPVPATPQHK